MITTEDQIKSMVDRFLGWRLPENFRPDAGISFKPTFNDHLPQPIKHNPTGTNLFDATQADAMVRFMLADLNFEDSTSDDNSNDDDDDDDDDDELVKPTLFYRLFGYWIRRDACRLAAQTMRQQETEDGYTYVPRLWSLAVFFEAYLMGGSHETAEDFGPKEATKLTVKK